MRARACVGGKVNSSHMIAHELHDIPDIPDIPECLIVLQTNKGFRQEV